MPGEREEMKSLSQQIVEMRGGCWHEIISSGTSFSPEDDKCSCGRKPKNCFFINPNYTEISKAWELFEELPNNRKILLLDYYAQQFYDTSFKMRKPKPFPEVICKAWIAWKEGRNETR